MLFVDAPKFITTPQPKSKHPLVAPIQDAFDIFNESEDYEIPIYSSVISVLCMILFTLLLISLKYYRMYGCPIQSSRSQMHAPTTTAIATQTSELEESENLDDRDSTPTTSIDHQAYPMLARVKIERNTPERNIHVKRETSQNITDPPVEREKEEPSLPHHNQSSHHINIAGQLPTNRERFPMKPENVSPNSSFESERYEIRPTRPRPFDDYLQPSHLRDLNHPIYNFRSTYQNRGRVRWASHLNPMLGSFMNPRQTNSSADISGYHNAESTPISQQIYHSTNV